MATLLLSEFCTTGSGGTPNRSKSQYYLEGNIPWIKSGELKNRVITCTEEYITEQGLKNSSAKFVPKGSLLVAMYGATVGQVSILGIDATTNQAVCHIMPDKRKCLPQFLYWTLKSKTNEFLNKRVGGGQPNISQGILKNTEIYLPPLSEQKRIAAILDQADTLREKRRAAIAKLDELLQSVFLDMFGDPVTNPKGWDKKSLSVLLSKIESGWSPKCDDKPVRGDQWGVLKLGSVTRCKFNASENKALPITEQPRSSLEVKTGDLLFTRKNTYDLVAATAYVWETPSRLMLPDLIFRLCISDNRRLHPLFLWQQLVNTHMRRKIQSLAGGAAGSMPNISKAKLRTVEVIVPPINLQDLYVDRLKKHRMQYEWQMQSLNKLDYAFHSLQQRAFRGEL